MGFKAIDSEEHKRYQLEILREVDSFCKENNIHYYLMYGSLIGAVRHKGIIPWDDDIDICMTRNNYDRFLSVFPSDKSNGIYVREQTVESKFPFYYAKVCMSNTHAFEPIDNGQFDVGISIDLFPLDPIPSDKKKRKKILRRVRFYRFKLIPHVIDYTVNRPWYKKVCLSVMNRLFKKEAFYYIQRIRKIMSSLDDNDTELITEIMTPYGESAIFPKSWFNESINLTFEELSISVPKKYDNILSQLYGDYMVPPPVEKQISHHSCDAYVEID